jgi:hypothetical protein
LAGSRRLYRRVALAAEKPPPQVLEGLLLARLDTPAPSPRLTTVLTLSSLAFGQQSPDLVFADRRRLTDGRLVKNREHLRSPFLSAALLLSY